MPRRSARTQEGYENHLISLAMNLSEKQLMEGTATAPVITHYLKMGAERDKRILEIEKLKRENELLRAKTESIDTGKRLETLYQDAIAAMRSYSGNADEEVIID